MLAVGPEVEKDLEFRDCPVAVVSTETREVTRGKYLNGAPKSDKEKTAAVDLIGLERFADRVSTFLAVEFQS